MRLQQLFTAAILFSFALSANALVITGSLFGQGTAGYTDEALLQSDLNTTTNLITKQFTGKTTLDFSFNVDQGVAQLTSFNLQVKGYNPLERRRIQGRYFEQSQSILFIVDGDCGASLSSCGGVAFGFSLGNPMTALSFENFWWIGRAMNGFDPSTYVNKRTYNADLNLNRGTITTSVPEPGSLALMGLAALGLLRRTHLKHS